MFKNNFYIFLLICFLVYFLIGKYIEKDKYNSLVSYNNLRKEFAFSVLDNSFYIDKKLSNKDYIFFKSINNSLPILKTIDISMQNKMTEYDVYTMDKNDTMISIYRAFTTSYPNKNIIDTTFSEIEVSYNNFFIYKSDRFRILNRNNIDSLSLLFKTDIPIFKIILNID